MTRCKHNNLPLLERIERLSVPEPNSGCYLWIGALDNKGYGVIGVAGKFLKAHRVSYEIHKWKIPAGLVIDHLCRVRSCINPAHMEVTTHRINILRGIGPPSQNAKKTHCPQGHLLEGTNIYINPNRGGRTCLICQRISGRNYMRKRRKKRYVLP